MATINVSMRRSKHFILFVPESKTCYSTFSVFGHIFNIKRSINKKPCAWECSNPNVSWFCYSSSGWNLQGRLHEGAEGKREITDKESGAFRWTSNMLQVNVKACLKIFCHMLNRSWQQKNVNIIFALSPFQRDHNQTVKAIDQWVLLSHPLTHHLTNLNQRNSVELRPTESCKN